MTSQVELTGLTTGEAQDRRARGLSNQIPVKTTRSYWQILRENVFTFINNVLFGLGIALVLLGRTSDALVSVGVIMINVVVSVIQEIRAKRVLDHIALITRPMAFVLRDGKEISLDPNEIVLDDILVVRPGDQIVVDGTVVNGQMDADESLLTGENDLVAKQPGKQVYSGSFCVNGSVYYRAEKVGAASFANEITRGARAFRRLLTPLQQQVSQVIRMILLIAVYLELLLSIDAILNQVPLVESVKMSVVVAGLVPNGLFIAIAVAYALGAVRIAGKGALVQQANAVESLSYVDVLCLDKTGTLTTNRIQFNELKSINISEAELRACLGDFASSFTTSNRTSEAIFKALGGHRCATVSEVPFSSERKWSGLVFHPDAGYPGVYILGAREVLQTVLERGQSVDEQASSWEQLGLRVVLFAYCKTDDGLFDEAGNPRLPQNLEILGLIGLSEELRPDTRQSLEEFSQAGVQVKIISGDNPDTVAALARQAGFQGDLILYSGMELAQMDSGQFSKAARAGVVFGRITPKQKEQLVLALRSSGAYVAMIGDGVNDVLSLKKANLAIAMQGGSQAARSAADIVLMNDSFTSLPFAVREGQRIINGMQDILKLFLTRVFYAALIILSCALIGAFPLAPKHNSILTLFVVGIPTLALAAWAQPGQVPRGSLVRWLLHFVLPASFSLAFAGLAVFLVFWVSPLRSAAGNPYNLVSGLNTAQTALTTFTILCGLMLVLFVEPPTKFWVGGDRMSGDKRPAWLVIGLLFVYGLVLFVPGLRNFFELTPLSWFENACLVGGAVLWGFLVRGMWRSRLLERYLNVDFRNFK